MDAYLQNTSHMQVFPFTELPTDVLFEILKLVNPFDLLQLARTTKSLRNVLMNRASQSIWTEAQSNVKGLPVCPSILSWPAYTELMFNESCSHCLGPGHTDISWGLFSRWCKECAESEFDVVKIKYKIGDLSLTNFLPHVTLLYRGQTNKTITLYHTESWLRWKELSSSEKEAWLSEKALAFKENETEIIARKMWIQRQNRKQRKQDRKRVVNDIIRRLELLGWGEEIAKSTDLDDNLGSYVYERDMPDDVWEKRKHDFIGVMKRERNARQKYERRKRIEGFKEKTQLEVIRRLVLLGWGDEIENAVELGSKLSPYISHKQKMTDEVWESRKHDFIGVMQKERAARLKLELGQRIKDCQPILIRIREDYARSSPVNTIIPPRANFYKHLPPFRTLIRSAQHGTNFTLRHFREAIDRLPSLIPIWIDITNARLLRRMQKALGGSAQLGVSDLALATSLFECTLCGTAGLNLEPCDKLISYPRVLVHRGAVMNSDCAKYAYDIHPIEYWTDQSLYNDHDTIKFSKDVYNRVTSLVTLCGLDPLTTTAQEMDELDPIFAPVNDLRSSLGRRFCMTWRRTVLHLKYHPHSRVKLVEGDMRINAKELLLEEQMTRWAKNQNFVCVHCREKDNLIEIQNHVRERHGCSNPTNDDFVVAMDADLILDAVCV